MIREGILKVNCEKTLLETNLDVKKLLSTSNDKVCVQCKSCKAEFLREFCNTHIKHTCSMYSTNNNIKRKWCIGCLSYVNIDEFKSPDQCLDMCNRCDAGDLNCNGKNLNKHFNRMYKSIYKQNNYGFPFMVGLKQIAMIYERQNGKCHHTGISLDLYKGSQNTALLCRLDHTDAYRLDNLVMIAKSCSRSDDSNGYINVEVKINDKLGKLPFRKRVTDAGYDIYAIEESIVHKHSVAKVNTGISVSPPPGYYYSLDGRSSLWSVGVIPFRGIVDGTYQGELIVVIMNSSDFDYKIKIGDRIAQLIFHKIINVDFEVVDEFNPVINGRLTNGFGSTGR